MRYTLEEILQSLSSIMVQLIENVGVANALLKGEAEGFKGTTKKNIQPK